MIYFLYSLALGAAMVASLPYWLLQMLRHGKYRKGFGERMGWVPARLGVSGASENGARAKVIWIHAVSVGEVIAVSGLVAALRRKFTAHEIVVSTTTDTGQEMARQRFGEENVFYFPMDFSFAIRPYLRALQPELVLIAETEFWPNFLREVHASGARIAVVNSRISDRSWASYRRLRWMWQSVLSHVDVFLAQTVEDAARLCSIGAGEARVRVAGNLKFDAEPPAQSVIVEKLRCSFAENSSGPVLVCGSTTEGEEALLVKTFQDLLAKHPQAVMILAPRHPERFEAVAQLLTQSQVRFRRRSEWIDEPLTGAVLLIDSIGELAALYSVADVAFVGGSLVSRGGHNILEPARYGVAILVGEHTENFRDMVALFQKHDAIRVVNSGSLLDGLMRLVEDPEERAGLGRRALQTVELQMGATERTMHEMEKLLGTEQTSERSVSVAQFH